MQKLPGVFGAEMVLGVNFAMKLTLFDAELGVEGSRGCRENAWKIPGGYRVQLGRDVCQIVGKIDLVSYLNGMGCEMFIYC